MPEPTEQVTNIHEPKPDSLEFAAAQLRKEPEPEKEEVIPEVVPETPAEEEEELELETETEVEETELELEPQVLEEVEEEAEELEEEVEELKTDYYAVKVDGENLEVTLDELQSGYQRQKDYTKKTQALADQRKSLEGKASELETAHKQFLTSASMANEVLNRDLKALEETNWEELETSDPVGYMQKQLKIQRIQRTQQELFQRVQDQEAHNNKVLTEQREEAVKVEKVEMLNLFPEWKDAEKAKTNQSEIIEYARTQGYDDKTLADIWQARDLLLLDKARKYDLAVSKKKGVGKKIKAPVRKVVRSKGPVPRKTEQSKKLTASKERLRKSGSLKDAAQYMTEMRESKMIKGQ